MYYFPYVFPQYYINANPRSCKPNINAFPRSYIAVLYANPHSLNF